MRKDPGEYERWYTGSWEECPGETQNNGYMFKHVDYQEDVEIKVRPVARCEIQQFKLQFFCFFSAGDIQGIS